MKHNSVKNIFYNHKGRTIFKWKHYLEAYDTEIGQFSNENLTILEIGIFKGGSLQLWKKFFGQNSIIHGIDINKNCAKFQEDRIKIHIGDQGDKEFLKSLGETYGPFDIIIDDGSHRMNHQIFSLVNLWPYLKNGGIYICEDTHTSYFTRFGGGYKKESTFVHFIKNKIDSLHMWWSGRMSENDTALWTKSLTKITYYSGIVFLYKDKRTGPTPIWSDHGEIREEPPRLLTYDRTIDPTG